MGKISDWYDQTKDWLSNNRMSSSEFNSMMSDRSNNSIIAKVWRDWTGQTNLDKSLQAQANENAVTREYNLELAKMQNEWNVAQWQRENAYNSPSAQKGRLISAGLNPDMMYGSGGVVNTSSSSPSLTSGASATPMDWSSLANRKTVGQSIMEGLSIAQARANVKKTEAEADIAKSDSSIRNRLNSLGLDKLQGDISVLQELDNLYNSQVNSVDLSNDVEYWKKEMRNKFGEKYVQNLVNKIAHEAEISSKQLEFEIGTLAQRIVGVNAENTPLVNIQNLSNSNLKLLIQILQSLLK